MRWLAGNDFIVHTRLLLTRPCLFLSYVGPCEGDECTRQVEGGLTWRVNDCPSGADLSEFEFEFNPLLGQSTFHTWQGTWESRILAVMIIFSLLSPPESGFLAFGNTFPPGGGYYPRLVGSLSRSSVGGRHLSRKEPPLDDGKVPQDVGERSRSQIISSPPGTMSSFIWRELMVMGHSPVVPGVAGETILRASCRDPRSTRCSGQLAGIVSTTGC